MLVRNPDVLRSLAAWLALAACAPALVAEEPQWAAPKQTPAPNQHRQSLYITPHPSLFTAPDVETVFERDAFPPREILPPEAYEDGAEMESGEMDAPGSKLQLVQYPMEDSAARDEDPEGHYEEPRWNPFPALKLPQLPETTERGLIWKDRAVTTTVLPGYNGNLGITSFDFRGTTYFGRAPFLQMAPRFGWHLLDGPNNADLPPQLYDFGLDTTLYVPAGAKWAFLGMAGPSMFSDFKNTSSQAFRMTGRAIAFYQWSETTKLAGGFLYLGRSDIKALPAGGVFYTPNPDVKAEIFFPKPKVSYRLSHDDGSERWCYLAGEFGGNSWAIQRANGLDDQVAYRDYRLILGLEQTAKADYRWLIETGFVFGRRIQYQSGIGDTRQPPTGMIRCGIVF
jgi:hypothetical protein